MDLLTEQQVKGFTQDVAHGEAKQNIEKMMFEKRLLGGLGEEMEDELNNPKSRMVAKKKKTTKKLVRKKKWVVWKENFKRILGL